MQALRTDILLCVITFTCKLDFQNKHFKSIWWMPWQKEAMKDVTGCDKPRGAANRL